MVVICNLVEAFMKSQTYTENHTEILYIRKFSPLSLVDFSLSIQCKLRILGLIRARIFILPKNQNRCQGINYASLCGLAGRYDNPIPTRLLAPPPPRMFKNSSTEWRRCTYSTVKKGNFRQSKVHSVVHSTLNCAYGKNIVSKL